jgi:uncharacterized membrane protein
MVRFTRWFAILLGGVLLGAGLVLHGQVALARQLRDEVDQTFVLWRAVGESTVFLQGDDVRMALAMAEVPPHVLRRSDVVAWTLVGVGLLVAAVAPLLIARRLARGRDRRRVSP